MTTLEHFFQKSNPSLKKEVSAPFSLAKKNSG
jgi:hypothetical protein